MSTERAPASQAEAQAPTPTSALDLYRARGYNVIVAADNLRASSPIYRIDYQEVRVNPDPNAGEVFKVGSVFLDGKGYEDRFALARNALERISIAAGVIWNPTETKVLEASRDYVLYQAVGVMRSPSGEVVILKGTKEIDMQVLEEEIREEQAVKVANEGRKNRREWDRKITYDDLTPDQKKKCDRAVLKEMVVLRKHKLARAETSAKNRAVRSMGIKSTYTPTELKRPFVVIRVVPDYNHPAVRARLKGQIDALYGRDPIRMLTAGAEGVGADPVLRVRETPPEEGEETGPAEEPGEVEEGQETAQGQGQVSDPPSDPAQGEIAHPAPEDGAGPGNGNAPATGNGNGKQYLNEQGAKFLVSFAEQFGVTAGELIVHVGGEYGASELTELTTEDLPKVKRWIQENRKAGKR